MGKGQLDHLELNGPIEFRILGAFFWDSSKQNDGCDERLWSVAA